MYWYFLLSAAIFYRLCRCDWGSLSAMGFSTNVSSHFMHWEWWKFLILRSRQFSQTSKIIWYIVTVVAVPYFIGIEVIFKKVHIPYSNHYYSCYNLHLACLLKLCEVWPNEYSEILTCIYTEKNAYLSIYKSDIHLYVWLSG